MTQAQLRVPISAADWPAHDDERELVERARSDRAAFAAIYRRHYRVLAAHVFRRTGNPHVTEDLVADVFLTALRNLPRYRHRGIPLRFWLLRIATNAVNRWARRQRRCIVVLPAEELEDPRTAAQSTPSEIDVERAQRALLSLSPKHQTVLALHHFEGLAVKEVAEVVGCRVGTVKSRLARAREALRARLMRRR